MFLCLYARLHSITSHTHHSNLKSHTYLSCHPPQSEYGTPKGFTKYTQVRLWMHMAAICVRRTCTHCGRVFGSSITALNFCYYVCCNCHQNSNHTPGTSLYIKYFLPEVRLAIQSSMSVSPLNCSLKGEEPFVSLGVWMAIRGFEGSLQQITHVISDRLNCIC